MKPYLVSLALGLLVGVIYALFDVRSPAPPVIALVGLLGILVGEQLPPLIKQTFASNTSATSWLRDQVRPHMFG
jgi:XapX domain-containing protein